VRKVGGCEKYLCLREGAKGLAEWAVIVARADVGEVGWGWMEVCR
jgi:hypothetical protein